MSVRTAHAFCDDVLGRYDATALAALIRSGEISATEATEAAIRRAEAVEPALGAIAAADFDRARQRSGQPRGGVFSGVPTFIKDMTDVAGLPTRFGTAALAASAPARKTHRIAEQLFEMGTINLGKSTMPEFGFTPSTEFPDGAATRNPWNLDRSAGGSSGGAAALVAAGVVPIANAADGGGSIRIPAAACGLVGLKPSRGRLPASQANDPLLGLVTDGVVTRSVRDTATFLAETERMHPNPQLLPIGKVETPLDRPLRIGAVHRPPTDAEVDEVVSREFAAAVQLLQSLGHEVEPIEIELPDRFVEDFLVLWSLLAWLVTVTSKWTVDKSFDKRQLTKVTQGLARQGLRHCWKAPAAIRRLRKSTAHYSAQFDSVDLMVSPTVGQLTPPIGHLGMNLSYEELFPRVRQWACFTPYANATGGPSLSLPLGFDEATNLPIGILFNADIGYERLLLETALQVEQAAPFRQLECQPA